jgi:hypothetical protein
MEKLKDILYDINDILLALFIIAIMTTVISWKFAGSFVGNANVPTRNEESSSFQPIEKEPLETNPIVEEPSIEEPKPEPKPEPEPEQIVVYTTVKIPSGSTGVGIAGIIKDAGIINSTTDFINRIEARGLSTKLQSGSFKIGSDMSLDEIINILTGQ